MKIVLKSLVGLIGLVFIALFSTGSRRTRHQPSTILFERECMKSDAKIRRRLPLFEEIICGARPEVATINQRANTF